VVDEAAMLDTRVTGELLAAARQAGAKVVLAGDDRQLASIERGGLFAALLLRRVGWQVDVFERSGTELSGRGAGIVTHDEMFAVLRRAGITLDPLSLGVPVPGRRVFGADGDTLRHLALPQVLTTWGRLHAVLRESLPDRAHHAGMARSAGEPAGLEILRSPAALSSARDPRPGRSGTRSRDIVRQGWTGRLAAGTDRGRRSRAPRDASVRSASLLPPRGMLVILGPPVVHVVALR